MAPVETFDSNKYLESALRPLAFLKLTMGFAGVV